MMFNYNINTLVKILQISIFFNCDSFCNQKNNCIDINKAIQNGQYSVVKDMIDNGFNINTKINGDYPIHVAAIKSPVFFLEYLIHKGADVNVVDSFGNTPLYDAFLENRNDVCNVLRQNGAKAFIPAAPINNKQDIFNKCKKKL